LTTHVMN